MSQTTPKDLVVCGHAGAERVAECVLPYVLGPLSMRQAHTRDELLAALSQCHPLVCITEHRIPTIDPVKELEEMFDQDQLDAGALAAKTQIVLSPGVTAYQVLPEFARRSPETRFVITSHTRGSGLSRAQHALYKQRPEVVKVMGFVNETSNIFYLLKLLSRVYFGKTWKGYAAA